MIDDVPAVTPVTIPFEEPIVAFALLLIQVPPVALLLSVVVKPAQTASVPVMFAGNGLTVTTAVAIQPVGNV